MNMTKAELEKELKKKDDNIKNLEDVIKELEQRLDDEFKQREEEFQHNMSYNDNYSYNVNLEKRIQKQEQDIEGLKRDLEYYQSNQMSEDIKRLKDHIVKLSLKIN